MSKKNKWTIFKKNNYKRTCSVSDNTIIVIFKKKSDLKKTVVTKMYKHMCIVVTVILSVFVNLLHSQNDLNSPCPDLFSYQFDGGEWYGMVEIPSPPLGQTIKLNVLLSVRVKLPTVIIYFKLFFYHFNTICT